MTRRSTPEGIAALDDVRLARQRVDALQGALDDARRGLRERVRRAHTAGATIVDIARAADVTRGMASRYLEDEQDDPLL